MDRPRVLVVEDDPDFADLLMILLEAAGYGVATADSTLGAAGLVESVRPAVILLDVGLPYRSGASLLDRLKADPSTAGIPVVIVTGMPEILTAERRRLATAVVEKPIDPSAFVDVVHEACGAAG